MTRQELVDYLRQHGVNPQYFHVEGVYDGWGTDTWYLRRSGNRWEVGYSERNKEYPDSYYDDEGAACAALLRLLRSSGLQQVPQEGE